MTADRRFHLILRDVGTLDHDFIIHHDRRGGRKIEFKVLVALVLGDGFGYYLNFNVVFSAQPGHHLFEVLSWLSVWFVEEKSYLQHGLVSLIICQIF